MTTVELESLTVEESAPGIIGVEWRDADTRVWFFAKPNGDDITEISRSPLSRRGPCIHVSGPISRKVELISPDDPAFKAMVERAIQAVREGGLATKAFAKAKAEREARAAQAVRDKAEKMREVLSGLGPLSEVPDSVLAEAYDQIQDSAI